MKRCPRCGKTYSDNDLNFCLDDGELLTIFSGSDSTPYKDDSPPTLVMDSPRVTNPIGWASGQPIQQWQGHQPGSHGYQGPPGVYQAPRDQTLPTIAMILGLLSIAMVCCFGGFYLGIPAAIIGYLGMRNADNDPQRYGGRGMAIAGLVIGIITFLFSLIHIILSALGNL